MMDYSLKTRRLSGMPAWNGLFSLFSCHHAGYPKIAGMVKPGCINCNGRFLGIHATMPACRQFFKNLVLVCRPINKLGGGYSAKYAVIWHAEYPPPKGKDHEQ
jgi:hypothetical protein